MVYNFALAAGFVIFGKWLLSLSGEQFVAAYPVLLALLVGYTFNYILFWNRPLLLSLGFPEFPIYVTLVVGLVVKMVECLANQDLILLQLQK